MTEMNKKQRNSSLDVLRVLSMFMIVLGHAFLHGGIINNSDNSVNVIVAKAIYPFLTVHVNCFVLVSGYFLCTSEFKVSKWIKLWMSALFWSVTVFAVLCVTGQVEFSITGMLSACLPFTQQRYWFVTTYLLMYTLVPVCNAAIKTLTQKQHLVCLVGFFTVFIFMQNLFFWKSYTTLNAYNPLFFLFLYFIAAYIRKYPFKKKHVWILGYVACMGFTSVYSIIEPMISVRLLGYEIGGSAFSGYHSITTVIGSVCFFMSFLNMDVNNFISKVATALSPLTFGVYLIHDQPEMREFIWKVLNFPKYIYSPVLLPTVIAVAVLIFVVCCCLERIRMIVFSFLKIDRICCKVSDLITKIVGKIFFVKNTI